METKMLTFCEMEKIHGGISGDCLGSIVSLGLTITGGLLSFAALNPIGVILSVGGIYVGGPLALYACLG